ncbi:DNA-binding transcriptional regulator CynR [Sodalis glossinidius str. 'morsitans']|uniref:DNA-binding transcriptional regulator CynR n=1 Tax=Sodalis glossinidius (strain morsitans) TaxID=343509 RepID=A0A193QMQ5_SODGM|nr:DNA-binding transcriptional regulator CynR [Sodalis glossinidius str. 'morsitans']
MAELIGDFRQHYPGIALEIAEFGGVTMKQAVLAGDLYLALTALTAEVDPELAALPLFSHPLCAVVPRRAPWLTRREVPFTLLGEWPGLNRKLRSAAASGIFWRRWRRRALV